MPATCDSAIDPATTLRRSAEAHGHEIGEPDPDRPARHAHDMVDAPSSRPHEASPGTIR